MYFYLIIKIKRVKIRNMDVLKTNDHIQFKLNPIEEPLASYKGIINTYGTHMYLAPQNY